MKPKNTDQKTTPVNRLLLLLFLLSSGVFGQINEHKRDSLQKVLEHHRSDTLSVHALKNLINLYAHTDSAKCLSYYVEGMEIAKKLGYLRGQINLNINLGTSYNYHDAPEKGLDHFFKADRLDPDTLFPKAKLIAISNMGNAYSRMKLRNKAIETWKTAIGLCERWDIQKTRAICANNIGSAYNKMNQFDKAAHYFLIAKDAYYALGDSMQAGYLAIGLSSISAQTKKHESALEFAKEALRVFQTIDNVIFIGHSYNAIGSYFYGVKDFEMAQQYYDSAMRAMNQGKDPLATAYVKSNLTNLLIEQGKYAEALVQYHEVGEIYKHAHRSEDQANIYNNISSIYLKMENYPQALRYANLILDEVDTQSPLLLAKAHQRKSYALEMLGQHREALASLKTYQTLMDSINDLEHRAALDEILTELESEKHLKNIELLEKEQKLTTNQLAQERSQTLRLYIGLGIVALLLIFTFMRFRASQKQKRIIAAQKDQVELQRTELEERNKEVLDSINYAERFQKAIFPSGEVFEKYLDAGFVMFIPKDIVSGDFFWVEGNDTYSFFAAADCTGHGVPGALVSVMCSNLLHGAVNEYKLEEPGKILDHVRAKLQDKFLSSDDIQDGMDIALCAWNRSSSQLKFAGANNPLYLFQDEELIEVKGDKQPVGKYIHTKPFTTHTLDVKPGDKVYLFSDGFADQFGGPKGKKFKYSNLKRLIADNLDLTMEEQQVVFRKAYMEWKAEYEQIDDVCLMGVEIPQS